MFCRMEEERGRFYEMSLKVVRGKDEGRRWCKVEEAGGWMKVRAAVTLEGSGLCK